MSLSVKQYYVSSTLTFGAILLAFSLIGCAGALVEDNRMVIISVGKNYINTCRMGSQEPVVAPTGETLPVGRWARIESTANGTVGYPDVGRYCVEIGNKTPPTGWFGHLMEFLGSVAPFVALAFGIPVL